MFCSHRYLVVVEPSNKKHIIENADENPVAIDKVDHTEPAGDVEVKCQPTGGDDADGGVKRKDDWKQKKRGQNKVLYI